MDSTSSIRIELDKALYVLFCLYAFSMSFELVLEKLFYIKTILKPFRFLSLAIIGTYGLKVLKNGMHLNVSNRADVWLYCVFIYGILVSCVQVIVNKFNLNLFYNDLLIVGLHVLTFFVFKSCAFTKDQMMKMLHYFVIGVFINSVYIFYLIFFVRVSRESGFIDNPNYAALGLVAAFAYLMLQTSYSKKIKSRLVSWIFILFLGYIFIVTGSRAGLAVLVIVLFFLFLFASAWRKVVLLVLSVAMTFQIIAVSSNYNFLGHSMVLIKRINYKEKFGEEDVRFVLWKGVFRIMEDRGYWGMGIGQYKANFPKYYAEESNKLILEIVNRGYYLSPHNDYLAVLADYGIPSLLFYLMFLFLVYKKCFRQLVYPSEEDDTARFLNRYKLMMLTCLIIFGMSAENFQHPLFWFLLMFSTKDWTK